MRTRSQGFTLIELMVALTIATITGLVVLQALATFQARRQTVTGGNDAEINASIGIYAIEREVRMAGAGYTTVSCTSFNFTYGTALYPPDTPPIPVHITDGGAIGQPDQIDILRSNADQGVAPNQVQSTLNADSLTVIDNAGFATSGAAPPLVLAINSGNVCTLLQATEAAVATSPNMATLTFGVSPYNPTAPLDAAGLSTGDSIINMGNFGMRRFQVLCNDNSSTPSATNTCDLKWFNPLTEPNPTMLDTEAVASQIVDLKAEYGISTAGGPTTWQPATGAWANPTADLIVQIKAIRIALVTRSNHQGTVVQGPQELVLWNDNDGNPVTLQFQDEEQHYRYQVLTVVIPLINKIWSGT